MFADTNGIADLDATSNAHADSDSYSLSNPVDNTHTHGNSTCYSDSHADGYR